MKQYSYSSKNKKFWIIIVLGALAFFIAIVAIICLTFYTKITSPAFKTSEITYIHIDEKKNYESVLKQLSQAQIKILVFSSNWLRI